MNTIIKIRWSALLILSCISCAPKICGRFTANVSPPYSDYSFFMGHFVHKVNGDVYGEFGKGKAKIKNDSLMLVFKELRKQGTEISINKKSLETIELNHQFKFNIVDSEDNYRIPGARIEFLDKKKNVVKRELTNYKGEANIVLSSNERFEKILISFVGFETIELIEDFSDYNELKIKWDSGWMKYISNTTEKYKILDLRKHLIKLESSDLDTFALVRKRLIRKIDNNKISHEDFIRKVKK